MNRRHIFLICISLTISMIIFTACFNGEPDGGDGGYNGSWEETTELRPDNYDTQGNFFGINTAVSSDGQMLLVGANGDSGTGKVYLYDWDSDTSEWAKSNLIASDIEDNDNYGGSVSVSDDKETIVIGSYYEDENGTNSGAVYVYKWNSGTSQWDETKLMASGTPIDNEYDRFGWSVDISGDGETIVVGACDDNEEGYRAGSMYVYKWNSGTSQWDESKILSSDIETEDGFGYRVSITDDGEKIVIGSPYKDNESGSAYIYEWNSGSSQWDETILAPTGLQAGDKFGYYTEISGSGNMAVIGVPNESAVNDYAGFVYVYRNNSGSWEEEAILSPEDGGTAGDRYGFSCAVSDDETTIAVSSPSYVPSGDLVDVGCVYIYRFNSNLENKWEETDQLLASNSELNRMFGWDVNLSDDAGLLLVGSPNDCITFELYSSAYVYRWVAE